MSLYNYRTDSGVIIPDTAEIRESLIYAFRLAFGEDIDVDPSTPSGALIAMLTEQADGVARNNAEIANQINPDLATGAFLDSLFALSGGKRKSATKSIVRSVKVSADANTEIPKGLIVKTINGDKFESLASATATESGAVLIDFIAVEEGPIICNIGDINTKTTDVLGIVSVKNELFAAEVGSSEETDLELRRRRKISLSLQSMGTNEAITARIFDVEKVKSVLVLDNDSSESKDLGAIYHLPPGAGPIIEAHSIWACVEGGDDLEIAKALHDSKSAGANYSGAIDVAIIQDANPIAYTIRFERPDPLFLKIEVTVRNNTLDDDETIPDIIMKYASGLVDGDSGFLIGKDVSPWEIAGALNIEMPELSILNVELALLHEALSSNVLTVYPWQIAKISREDITVIRA